ncbi:MAG: right-handed parallel beta-helix repeat-containing protein [Candidatus Bathyarchaeota archaeon]
MKKSKAIIVLLLILSFTLVSISEIGIVKAEDTIYIRADGTVEGTNMIQRNGSVYTLTGSIYYVSGGSISVERSNIIIDGNGHTFSSPVALYGIYLSKVEGVTIKNMVIRGGLNGIFIDDSTHVTISGNTITEIPASYPPNPSAAIILRDGGYHRIVGNNITGNYVGIRFSSSSNNRIFHNNFIDNHVDVYDPSWNYPQNTPSTYSLDNGYPSGGNYWSNYKGTDLYSGVYQNETGSDDIGDTPYVFIVENETVYTDYYPLVEPVPVIPEFPSWIILPLVLMATFVGVIVKKRLSQSVTRCTSEWENPRSKNGG